MIVLDLSILNQKGTPMFNSDTFANRPAFGIVGRIFISTDTKEFFRDTGTSWELIGGPGSGTITGSGAATQVAFWNSASTITGSNNLFWDSTNNYLGISTNTPTTALDVHHSTNSGAIFNQTTATNNNTINFQTSGSGRWRIGNFYTAGADDFGIFDVVGSLQQLTILKTTGQTFIGAKTTASGRLVVNSATADAHLQVVGANSPSIRIDNAGSGGTQRFVFGLATATNNFIQGAAAGQFCISTQSSGAMLFGMWQTINASEVMRITTSNNLVIGSTFDGGQRLQVTGTGYFSGNVGIGISAPLTFRASVYLNGAGIQNTLELNNIHQTVGVVDGVRLKIREFNIESSSTYGSTDNVLTFGISTIKQLTLTEAGNLGLGVTPSAWGSNWKALELSNGVYLTALSSSTIPIMILGANAYFDNTNFIYKNTAAASRYQQDSGSHYWYNAPSGTAGNTISFTQSMTLTSGGNLLVGTATDIGARLFVQSGVDVLTLRMTSGGYNALTLSSNFPSGNDYVINNYISGVSNGGLEIFDKTNSVKRIVIANTSGNVGINCLATNAKLEVVSTSGEVFRADAAAGSYRIVATQTKVNIQGQLNLAGLPTSPVGLVAGDVWNNLGILNIV